MHIVGEDKASGQTLIFAEYKLICQKRATSYMKRQWWITAPELGMEPRFGIFRI